MAKQLLLGQVLFFLSNPFREPVESSVRHEPRGGVLVNNGKIERVGSADELRAESRNATIRNYGNCLITAGFIDAHVHYCQTAVIASWGVRLIDWLNNFTFPEEARFADHEHAAKAAKLFFDLTLGNGTTTACSFCTSHPESVNAYFEEALRRDLLAAGGLTCMDRNVPEGLCDTPKSAYDESKRLLTKWDGEGRLNYAISPRFAPTSSPQQLEALGALWAEHPTCIMQTHLAEQVEEIEWVRKLFPNARDYLDVYDSFGLVGKNGLYGHAIHLSRSELARMREAGGALVHCPTSNTFIGSGLFELKRRAADAHSIGLASDIGGGSSFSMLRTMAAAYEISQLTGSPLHPYELYWLATRGNAEIMNVSGQVGNIVPGLDADLIVLNLRSTVAIDQRAARAENFAEELFPTIMMGDDRAVRSVWVHGREIISKD